MGEGDGSSCMARIAQYILVVTIQTADLVMLKALCHDIRLECFIIASLVANSNYHG